MSRAPKKLLSPEYYGSHFSAEVPNSTRSSNSNLLVGLFKFIDFSKSGIVED